jgi:hypothetical protein
MRDLTPLYSAVELALAYARTHAMSLTDAIRDALDNYPEIETGDIRRLATGEDMDSSRQPGRIGLVP